MNVGHGPIADAARCGGSCYQGRKPCDCAEAATEIGVDDDDGLGVGAFVWPMIVLVCVAAAAVVAAVA